MVDLYLQRRTKLFFLIFFFLFISSVYSEKSDFEFGKWLFEREEYFRAVSEFQRFIFFNPLDPKIGEARFLIGLSLFKAQRYSEAAEVFDKASQDKNFSFIAGIYKADSLFLQGDYKKSKEEYLSIKERMPEKEMEIKERMLWPYLMERRFDNVISILEDMKQTETSLEKDELKERVLKLKRFKPLSPLFAGTLSLFIPGAGQIYAKRPGDGLIAFASVASLTAASFLLWKYDPHKELALCVSVLDIFLYAGNIYSAWSQTIRFNSLYYKKNIENIKETYWKEYPYK